MRIKHPPTPLSISCQRQRHTPGAARDYRFPSITNGRKEANKKCHPFREIIPADSNKIDAPPVNRHTSDARREKCQNKCVACQFTESTRQQHQFNNLNKIAVALCVCPFVERDSADQRGRWRPQRPENGGRLFDMSITTISIWQRGWNHINFLPAAQEDPLIKTTLTGRYVQSFIGLRDIFGRPFPFQTLIVSHGTPKMLQKERQTSAECKVGRCHVCQLIFP